VDADVGPPCSPTAGARQETVLGEEDPL
jgi:hypothetical protein